ncbi:MAG: BrnT family toxin [Deltaproteobacteria bacterium]|nr:BrnT family toxin [Deltaproteobacteria bacterium]
MRRREFPPDGATSKGVYVFVIDDIIWLETVVEKLAWKHNVLTSEAEEVLVGDCRIFKKENGKVEGEHLYNALGKTTGGRYLSVFFIRKLDNKALIVTARDMNRRERNRYETK